MSEDNGKPSIPVARLAKVTIVRCREHAKQARYRVMWYEEDKLLVVECLECKPPTPILKAAIDTTRVVTP